MKVNAVVDVGLLLKAIQNAGYAGIEDAGMACQTAPGNFRKLLDFRGDLPRCDALFRICNGLNIDIRELVISAGTHKKENGSQGRVLPGRWPTHPIAGHDR